MRDTNLVNALREHAEWSEGNQWETPITLCDDLAEAADRIEAQAKEIDALRNELCLKCGNYTRPMRGPVMDVGGGGKDGRVRIFERTEKNVQLTQGLRGLPA